MREAKCLSHFSYARLTAFSFASLPSPYGIIVRQARSLGTRLPLYRLEDIAHTMQFYFIRHGQSENNLLWDKTGSSAGRVHDPELTEKGLQQARRVAQFLAHMDPEATVAGRDPQNLAGFGITHLYTSLMVRAVGTASVIAGTLNMPFIAWPDAHETGGIYLDGEREGERIGQPGFGRSYFRHKYPRLQIGEEVSDKGWWNRPYEEEAQIKERADRFLRDLLARHGGTDDHVALVSHGGFYNFIMRMIFQIGNQSNWLEMNNTAITRLDFEGDHLVCCYMNRVDFLPKELIT